MKSLFLFTFLISFTAFSQTKKAAPKASAAPGAAQLARGKQIYENNCMVCHQETGDGVPGLNPPLIKTPWVLGEKPKLINVILKGLQEPIEINGERYNNIMPANDFLSDQEISDVLTFVRTNFGNNASAISAAEVKAVRDRK
ncbi:c-type cytochrome [Runella sp.]|uniref:c-type cytochrome n=1 Tax=Runella sp. TaxID=1960881 RepID=UPI003D14DDB1